MSGLSGWKLWLLLGLATICACLPVLVKNDYLMQVFFRIVLFAALGLAWNLVGGYAGQLSLGHVAFFGAGAYGLALLMPIATRVSGFLASIASRIGLGGHLPPLLFERILPMGIAVFLAAVVATLFAAIIGRIVFRLRGPYFTLSTIAFGEVLRLTVANLPATGGAIGLSTPTLFTGRAFWKMFYLSAVALALVSFVVNLWTSRSRFGYYLMAIREDEETASAVGIDTASCKLRALLMSAFLTALGGALYGSAYQFIVPDSVLTIEISVQIAILTMLGGAGTLLGPVVGAVLLLTASEVFKNQFQETHLLIYGILIVVVVLFLPEGIVGGIKQLLRKKSKPPAGVAPAGPAPSAAREGS